MMKLLCWSGCEFRVHTKKSVKSYCLSEECWRLVHWRELMIDKVIFLCLILYIWFVFAAVYSCLINFIYQLRVIT